MDTKILRDLSYGVYIATTKYDNKNVGCTINSVIQVTTNKIAISINHDNYTNKCIKKNNMFAISILSEKSNPKLIGTFGYNSSRDIDKFNDVEYEYILEIPVIKDTLGYVVCKVVDIIEVDTHTIFIGEIKECNKYNNEIPMTYLYYHKELKGKTPKNAPTYIPDEKEEAKENKKKNIFVCRICGYKFESDLDELSDDFKCPICGRGKEFFEKI